MVFLVVVAGARWLRRDTPTLVWVSGAFGAVLAVRGDAPYCNEKSANLAACLLVGGVLFRPLAIQGTVSPGHRRCDTPGSQKAPSAIRCIKTWARLAMKDSTAKESESTERHKVH